MTEQTARSPEDHLKLAYAARMMLISAAIFVLAGMVWLVSGAGVLVGWIFVAVGALMITLARALLVRIGPRPPRS